MSVPEGGRPFVEKQLREPVRYQASGRGIRVITGGPADTSPACHRCHELGKRTLGLLTCTPRGEFDADIHAAKNIAAGGARAGDLLADRTVARIVEFFAGESLHRIQSKAGGP